ncbi:PLD nuclease N-terminal domain-containing protein [Clostridioides difficile]|nr:hypothetical protein [Clostridioides difficile]UWD48877.1 PLD nuclease N-terminal domain-containing protein [Clostridioides difficile]
MESLMEYLPILIPVIIIDLVLIITALIHVIKHPNYRFGNKAIWILIVLFISIIGPILYFAVGRGDE